LKDGRGHHWKRLTIQGFQFLPFLAALPRGSPTAGDAACQAVATAAPGHATGWMDITYSETP
jgi:hypothetical protein